MTSGHPDWQHDIAPYWSIATDTAPTMTGTIKATWTVPAGTRWQPIAVYCKVTTTGTVANRELDLFITDAAAVQAIGTNAHAAQAASLTYFYNFAPAFGSPFTSSRGDTLHEPLPNVIIPGGWHIGVVVNNFQAGDAILTPRLTYLQAVEVL